MATPSQDVVRIVHKMHLCAYLAELSIFILVELHLQPYLDHSVAIFRVVSSSLKMISQLIFRCSPRRFCLLTFNKHYLVLVNGSTGSSSNFEGAEVRARMLRRSFLGNCVSFTHRKDETKNFFHGTPIDILVRLWYPYQKVKIRFYSRKIEIGLSRPRGGIDELGPSRSSVVPR